MVKDAPYAYSLPPSLLGLVAASRFDVRQFDQNAQCTGVSSMHTSQQLRSFQPHVGTHSLEASSQQSSPNLALFIDEVFSNDYSSRSFPPLERLERE
jgi:hypothetical protein